MHAHEHEAYGGKWMGVEMQSNGDELEAKGSVDFSPNWLAVCNAQWGSGSQKLESILA